jgi:AAHS family 4-hydroxybenzoate transporter-like MFS transporter
VIGGILLSMHLPISQMFYAASGLFLVAAIFSTVLAVLYKARFGEQHKQDDARIKEMRSALGDS